ncbi:efflux RND transporter periplasmic adaptor subunit [Sediminibacterium roseum]|uniref:Efflux RND transporter periplasmic adaptor subunit n=1 Tax=Sediminibacterium roseum TaxID=1978412 RepID=A0ABX0A0G1_9BACT|nr:efflux RND transporter periplasmic adaptor subunit [Sediminibacterium roseum]NCI52024.1 efflux RND transporter periplasmic adaptor subunit [Sediminibacterium roseum]
MKQVFIISTMALLLSSCGGEKKEEAKEPDIKVNGNTVTLTDAQLQNTGIQTAKLSTQSLSSVLKVSGKVDVPPQNMVSVSVPLGGYLKSTKLLPGTHVVKGEVLAVIEDQQYIQIQQDYLTAKSQFAYNESEYNRQRELNQSKATSDKVFEQTKAAYQSQNVLMKALEEKLKLIGINPAKITANTISRSINIYSPIAGYVSAVNVNIGKYVTPSDVLFELVNPTDIHLALTVFEKDIDKLFIGQKLLAYTNTQPEKKHPSEILLINKDLSAERSTMVHCHFEQYDKTLLPGMFMNADIEVKNNNVKALPEESVVRFANKQYVFIAKSKHQFEMVEIQAGVTEKGFTEIIIDPKHENESFVTKGAYTLLMKMKNTAEE